MKKFIAAFLAIPAGWCIGGIFLLTGAESALLIGVLVPGEVTAILGGVIASNGRVNLWAAAAAAVTGAWCGDSAGYFFGRRAGRGLFGRKRKKEWGRARKFLQRGGVAVLLGRFTPFVRTIIPAAAGAAGMPYRRFLPWNLPSGLAWGVASTLIGFWGGRNAEQMIHRVGLAGTGLLVVVIATLFVLWKRFVRRRPHAPRARRRRSAARRAASR